MGKRTRKATNASRSKKRVEAVNGSGAKRQRGNSTIRKPRIQGLNWDERYGNIKKYKKQCAIAHKAVHGLCCCCLKKRSEQLHHAAYGNDLIGATVFPVCRMCHDKVCHSSTNWIKDKINPVWKSRNTKEFTDRLKLGYNLLYEGVDHG